MDYLSEDENEEIQEQTFDELYPVEEMDEETRQLIYGNINEEDFLPPVQEIKKKNKKENKKEIKEPVNKKITLEDLIKESNEKNKKWTSQRAETKKPKENKPVKEDNRRKFNPRLPKYEYAKKYSKESRVSNTNTSFPTLE